MDREVQKILYQIPCFHCTDLMFTWAIFASDLFKRRYFLGGYFLPKHNLGGTKKTLEMRSMEAGPSFQRFHSSLCSQNFTAKRDEVPHPQ